MDHLQWSVQDLAVPASRGNMLDLVIVLAFIAYAIYSGFKSKSLAGQNLKEYFLAGNSLKGWKAGLSMSATQFAADTPLLVTGIIASSGIHGLWRLWIYGLAFLMLAFVFASKWRDSGVITDAELTTVRYSGNGVLPLRAFKAIYYGTVINCVVLAMVLVAATRIAEVFLPWDQWLTKDLYTWILNLVQIAGLELGTTGEATHTTNNLLSIFLILCFTTLYSTTGGLRSVVATDVMQFALAMGGTLAYAIFLIIKVGGISSAVNMIYSHYGNTTAMNLLSFSPSSKELLLPFFTIIGLQWFFQMNSDGTGYLAQRLMACSSDREASRAALIFTWTQILLRSLIWLVIGVCILALYPYEASEVGEGNFVTRREMLFISGIKDTMPIGFLGLMLAGLLGALASTIDTHLNWGASYWSNDIYKGLICESILKRKASNKELVWVARFSNLLILFISVMIMFNLNSINEAWKLSLLFGAGMGSVLFLRWLWERINLYSELAAMISSLLTAPLMLIFFKEDWLQLLIMAVVTTASAILITFMTPGTDEKVLDDFYKRVHPQGFWRKTAKRNGDDPLEPLTRFKKRLGGVLITAISMFLCLVGSGRLLLWKNPDTSAVVSCLLLAVGIALIPIWWRKVNKIYDN